MQDVEYTATLLQNLFSSLKYVTDPLGVPILRENALEIFAKNFKRI